MMTFEDGSYWYTVEEVNPEPRESPEGSVYRKGGFRVRMRSPARLKQYQKDVQEAFKEQNPGFINLQETSLSVRFYLWRNVPIYETPSGQVNHGNYADATNCQKALEDALQGILYANDTNNIHVSTVLEQGPDVSPFILIEVAFTVPDLKYLEMKHRLSGTYRQPEMKVDESNKLGPDRDIF